MVTFVCPSTETTETEIAHSPKQLAYERSLLMLSLVEVLEWVEVGSKIAHFLLLNFFFKATQFFLEKFLLYNTLSVEFIWILTYIWYFS